MKFEHTTTGKNLLLMVNVDEPWYKKTKIESITYKGKKLPIKSGIRWWLDWNFPFLHITRQTLGIKITTN